MPRGLVPDATTPQVATPTPGRAPRHRALRFPLLLLLAVCVSAMVAVACSEGSDRADASPAVGQTDAGDTPDAPYGADDELRMNQIQGIGTHNSYHPGPLDVPLPEKFRYLEDIVDYRHKPLAEQLGSLGVRHVELDVWSDPEGGRFVQRPLLEEVGGPVEADDPAWNESGLKVLHIAQVDPDTTCVLFTECLEQIDQWSLANPMHAPLMVLVEIKDVDFLGTQTDPPLTEWTDEDYQVLDDEIRSVFDDDRLITPDDVQGDHASVEEAVLTDGWPTMGEARGKVMFVSCNCLVSDRHRVDYVRSDGSLSDRVMFAMSEPGNPDAAIILREDPIGQMDEIRDLVAKGYMVRTRSDANVVEARDGDTARRDAAFESGAHFISTDYPEPDPVVHSDFVVQIPGGTPLRCNPVNAPATCQATDVEDPAHLRR